MASTSAFARRSLVAVLTLTLVGLVPMSALAEEPPDTTPPTVSIDTGPANPTNSTSASFTFTVVDPISGGVASGVASVECKLDAGAWGPCDSATAHAVTVSEGSHTLYVRATDNAGNTSTEATYSWVVTASTSLLYLKETLVIVGSNLPVSAQINSPLATCTGAGVTITFSLDRNPLTGAAVNTQIASAVTNAFGIASTTVSTAGWIPGIYEITAAFAGTATCSASSYSAVLTVASPGDSATGGGWYTERTAGRINFGFTVQRVPNTSNPTQYKGQFLLINNGKWKLKGSLDNYGKLSANKGAASGTGDLFWWNPALNGGLGGWQLAASGVGFSIQFQDNGSGAKRPKDTMGVVNILYTPISPQPSTLPKTPANNLASLKGGDIRVW
jgi:hypothetical protein